MKISEKLDHMFRHYSYKKKRGFANHQTNNKFEIEAYLAEVSTYVDEVMEQIDSFLSKNKKL
ncbi:MAG TPA: hypothetical protein GX707_18950 [Epulopiscium sp.]|nr:hypothetical protein [Candidatus Epulonipiscium sp.]